MYQHPKATDILNWHIPGLLFKHYLFSVSNSAFCLLL